MYKPKSQYLFLLLSFQSIIGLSQRIRLPFVNRITNTIVIDSRAVDHLLSWVGSGVSDSVGTGTAPFACLAFTVTVLVAKEVFAVETSNFFADIYRPQHFNASGLTSSTDEPTVGSTVVVDIGGRSQPELGAILPTRVHHWKVIDARLQDLLLFLLSRKSLIRTS